MKPLKIGYQLPDKKVNVKYCLMDLDAFISDHCFTKPIAFGDLLLLLGNKESDFYDDGFRDLDVQYVSELQSVCIVGVKPETDEEYSGRMKMYSDLGRDENDM